MSKVFMEHIPRTIFGVKFDWIRPNGDKVFNKYQLSFTKNRQLKDFKYFSSNPRYSEVKLIRWHINANDEV